MPLRQMRVVPSQRSALSSVIDSGEMWPVTIICDYLSRGWADLMQLSDNSGLRIALVGCGYWGSKHARVLHSAEGVAEVVLVDGQEGRLRTLSRTYKTARCFPALRPALPDVDAVVVATPPSTHVNIALTAIRAGKHVLVE